MTRTTPELATTSPGFRSTPAGGRLTSTYDLACSRLYTGSSVESGFEPATFQSRGRDLTTRPPRHWQLFTFSYTKYTKRKYCNRQKIRTRDFHDSPRFTPP
ncbi:hypothetical protein AVEN_167911-1 [Araneus ventricosus]|uniref:Uncharacterized protein n=1 Tax=Araneus ventricosus TaxID=182803 RepID=A0A4Y2FYE5_ARAVE|nr:hypothetical protein AVEN_167911-1 [Araneus ventricosus]